MLCCSNSNIMAKTYLNGTHLISYFFFIQYTTNYVNFRFMVATHLSGHCHSNTQEKTGGGAGCQEISFTLLSQKSWSTPYAWMQWGETGKDSWNSLWKRSHLFQTKNQSKEDVQGHNICHNLICKWVESH